MKIYVNDGLRRRYEGRRPNCSEKCSGAGANENVRRDNRSRQSAKYSGRHGKRKNAFQSQRGSVSARHARQGSGSSGDAEHLGRPGQAIGIFDPDQENPTSESHFFTAGQVYLVILHNTTRPAQRRRSRIIDEIIHPLLRGRQILQRQQRQNTSSRTDREGVGPSTQGFCILRKRHGSTSR